MSVSWHVELAIRPGKLEAFQALCREMAERARHEEGVLVYERHVNPDGTVAHVYERYRDSGCAAAHLRTFADEFAGRFSDLVERRAFTVYGPVSPELRALLDRFGASAYLRPLAGFSAY